MIGEIAAAVSFISKFLRTKGLTSERQLQTFSQSLQELLAGERAAVEGRGCLVGRGPHTPGPSRRGGGSRVVTLAGRAPVQPRDLDWSSGRPLTAGPGEGLGASPRAVWGSSPTMTGKMKGEKETDTQQRN